MANNRFVTNTGYFLFRKQIYDEADQDKIQTDIMTLNPTYEIKKAADLRQRLILPCC